MELYICLHASCIWYPIYASPVCIVPHFVCLILFLHLVWDYIGYPGYFSELWDCIGYLRYLSHWIVFLGTFPMGLHSVSYIPFLRICIPRYISYDIACGILDIYPNGLHS